VVSERNVTDEELVAAAQVDRTAFAPLYGRYADPVYRYCLRRLRARPAAEDVAATVFERALLGLPNFTPRETPDVRNPTTPPRVLAFFSPDLLARGRIDVLPDPWRDAYPVAFGWEDWQLPAATVRRLADDRILVLLDSATSASDHAALVMAPSGSQWLIDEIAYVTDDPAELNPAADCALPAPTAPRPAPD
jgi:hypothetical protein